MTEKIPFIIWKKKMNNNVRWLQDFYAEMEKIMKETI